MDPTIHGFDNFDTSTDPILILLIILWILYINRSNIDYPTFCVFTSTVPISGFSKIHINRCNGSACFGLSRMGSVTTPSRRSLAWKSQHIYKTSSLPAIKHENGWNIHVKYHPPGFSQLLKNDELLKTLGMSKLPKLYGTCARWCPELWLVYVASPWTIYIYMYIHISTTNHRIHLAISCFIWGFPDMGDTQNGLNGLL